jgi:hypothetical protein
MVKRNPGDIGGGIRRTAMKVLVIRILLSGYLVTLLMACTDDKDRIEKCVEAELKLHREAHLVDLYKYFFQDVFGPGHLISGREGPAAYLDEELAGAKEFEPFDYQELKYNNQFVRVNLRMINNAEISKTELLDAFMQSAREFTLPETDQWRKEWTGIYKVIRQLHPDLPGISSESLMIDSLLLTGNYAVHHSRDYIRAYDPHYRLIHRKYFNKLIFKDSQTRL